MLVEGKQQFRFCKACHSLTRGGEVIVGGGSVGPDLFDVIGRRAAGLRDYDYSSGLRHAGEIGLVWTEDNFVRFTANPNRFLSDFSNRDLRSKMPFSRKEGVRAIAAYLVSISSD